MNTKMDNVSKKIVKYRVLILILSLLLLIPAFWGFVHTRVNYDILSYLPEDIETMKGQDILVDEFGTGAYSMLVCEGMKPKDTAALKAEIEKVENVEKVVWYDSFLDISVPMDILPEDVRETFQNGDSTLMFLIFKTTTSADETMDAIREIRSLAGKQCFLSGMSAIVTDTKDLSDSEVVSYVIIAVILSAIVLALALESYLVPFLFLFSIGMAILYNLGSNIFFGEVSYITKALSAVLQLGVTMDYSIFLWHSYQEQKEFYPGQNEEAMAKAISATIKSVTGSSITTVAGFIALCFMSFTLGMDLGVVMAKGVVFGVICCITVLPSMILVFDKWLEKTKHRALLPEFPRFSDFIMKHYRILVLLFVLIFIPAAYFQSKTNVYYNLDESLPDELECIQANQKLHDKFDMGAVHMMLLDRNMAAKDKYQMLEKMKKTDGVKTILGLETVFGAGVPESMIPESMRDLLQSRNYEWMLISSEYQTATDEVNAQIGELNRILKKYDPHGMLVGEAPCIRDLIKITDKDFKVVSVISILVVFLIIAVVFKSISLPVILILVIEGAIFINLGIPYLTGTTLPFIASIVIGTIQLGATVDYAILMTSRYEKERAAGAGKKEAICIAHRSSTKSVIVSGCSFFAATVGVGIYSKIDMISSLCTLLSRGALISMAVVLIFLPALFMIFDPVICKTSKGFKQIEKEEASL